MQKVDLDTATTTPFRKLAVLGLSRVQKKSNYLLPWEVEIVQEASLDLS